MEGRNISPIITLSAALITCIFCIRYRIGLYQTCKMVFLVMIIFYIIGRIVTAIYLKINKDAEALAMQRQREQQEQAAKELAEQAKQEELEKANQNQEENKDVDTAE